VTPPTFDVLLHRAIASLKKALEASATAPSSEETSSKKRNGDV
jgi:hypothetical protein